MVAVRERIIKANKSLHFLLPMLGITYGQFKSNILNSYIGDRINRPELVNYHIFILCRLKDARLESLQGFVESYEVEEGLMYVFRVDEEYEEDYLRFILGQYSQFSGEFKTKIMKLLPSPYQNSPVFKVITKSLEAKLIIEEKVGQSIGDQEVMSIPDFNSEVYG